ncbi:interleukin enhancer-binding factor 2 homolog [Exaiptasia diaphana]|uniref:DZF domain-containing protein n=1 Tax=Exaiptasia diaphana TaxID=2652724 RepID=A0A913XAQ4_EXADI|nr:interleukin enhancer-binding factor 2 homolog [Exaiptasia diaphana]
MSYSRCQYLSLKDLRKQSPKNLPYTGLAVVFEYPGCCPCVYITGVFFSVVLLPKIRNFILFTTKIMHRRRAGRGRAGRMPPFMRNPMGQKYIVSHVPFDPVMAEPFFPKASPQEDDAPLTQALLKRNQELTPSMPEQTSVQNIMTKITSILDNLIVAPDGAEFGVEEVRAVGSYKKGTMMLGHPVADLAVILKKLPAEADILSLAARVQKALKEEAATGDSSTTTDFPMQANEGGFNISGPDGALVRVLITTLPKNLREADPTKHVDVKLLEGALATIRHARWFEENAFHTSIRILVRLLKDMRKRIAGLQGLTPWLIDLLAHRSAMASATRQPLNIQVAFKRALQLLSAGLFLPGSQGIVDPCEGGQVRAHSVLSLEEQDSITTTAQTLLRCLNHGAFNEILGLNIEGMPPVAVDTEVTSWGGVIVTPGSKAYEKQEEKPEEEGEGEEGDDEEAEPLAQEEDKMETS